jgi:hypothetical protein
VKRLIPALLLIAGCGSPGQAVAPQTEDFAFLEVKLKG